MTPSLGEWLSRPQDVAARLRALRARAGLSGDQLGERLGWAQSKVSRIETGKQAHAAHDDIGQSLASTPAGSPYRSPRDRSMSALHPLGRLHRPMKRRLSWATLAGGCVS